MVAFYAHSMQWVRAAEAAPRVAEAYRARGDLWSAAESGMFTGSLRAGIAYLRGNLRGAERFFSYRKHPLTYLSGSAESCRHQMPPASRSGGAMQVVDSARWPRPADSQNVAELRNLLTKMQDK
jgi:hypothetical protein